MTTMMGTAACAKPITSSAFIKSNSSSINLATSNNADNYNYIYMIRHGEKVTDDSFGLSPSGINHAQCLANTYFPNFIYGKPNYVLAEESGTDRAMETGGIIAHKLKVDIKGIANRGNFKKVDNKILEVLPKYNRVLVVWENNAIPKLGQLIGCSKCNAWNYDPTSGIHNGHLFNSTWVFKYPRKNSYSLDSISKYNVEFQVFNQNWNGTVCENTISNNYRTY